ncbi:hypothetical protein D3C87_78860 [compost metagenome]
MVKLSYWIKYKKCPICETHITRKFADTDGRYKYDTIYCCNGCFDEQIYGPRKECMIFGKYFSCEFSMKEEVEIYTNNVQKEIEFWRKDNRFLLELMSS